MTDKARVNGLKDLCELCPDGAAWTGGKRRLLRVRLGDKSRAGGAALWEELHQRCRGSGTVFFSAVR